VLGIWLGLTGAVPAPAGLRLARQLDRDGSRACSRRGGHRDCRSV